MEIITFVEGWKVTTKPQKQIRMWRTTLSKRYEVDAYGGGKKERQDTYRKVETANPFDALANHLKQVLIMAKPRYGELEEGDADRLKEVEALINDMKGDGR